jgi:hypothetical protein
LSKSPAAQDEVNKRSPGPAVAIHERMYGLKLRMRDRCLGNGRQRLLVAKGAKVGEEVGDQLGRWGDECG